MSIQKHSKKNGFLFLALTLQILAALSWMPMALGFGMGMSGAGESFERTGLYLDQAVFYFLAANFGFVNIGWPVLGIVAWTRYYFNRDVKSFAVISSVPLIQVILVFVFLFLSDWLR